MNPTFTQEPSEENKIRYARTNMIEELTKDFAQEINKKRKRLAYPRIAKEISSEDVSHIRHLISSILPEVESEYSII